MGVPDKMEEVSVEGNKPACSIRSQVAVETRVLSRFP
jgi:hypothetical protein